MDAWGWVLRQPACPGLRVSSMSSPHSKGRGGGRLLCVSPERALLMNPAWRASSRESSVKISATTGLLFFMRRPSSLYSRKPENSAGIQAGGGGGQRYGHRDTEIVLQSEREKETGIGRR